MQGELRVARREDVAEIQRVRHAVRENRLTSRVIGDDEVVEHLERRGRGWVVTVQGAVAAFAIGDATNGNIWALFVDPAHEARGYGRRLHDEMVGWMLAQGHASLWLTTAPGTRAEGFYRKAGWRDCGLVASGERRFEMRRPDMPVEIAPYDPGWPRAFAKERDMLLPVLEPWLAGGIEHVGSTAVPGLAAKPVIDIMAPVRDLESSRPALALLEALGYCYAPFRADVMHWLCKPRPERRTHHLHLVPMGSRLWRERIAFRDLLVSNAALALDYAALKQRLAAEHRGDRERYTEAKGPFIEGALRAAGG